MTTSNLFLKTIGGLFLTLQMASAAPDYFRFEPGSSWVYRAEGRSDSFTIQVGVTGVLHNGHVHYRVTGYVDEPVLAYRNESNGALYYLDPETDQDVLLTSVERNDLVWFNANKRKCDQLGQGQPELVPFAGPAGRFPNALLIRYRTLGCADAGVDEERYVENIGMVQRTLQTFAGPVVYNLVHASVGAVSLSEAPNTSFRVGLRPVEGKHLVADLRLTAALSSVRLTFPTSQEYDVVLRTVDGAALWRWSAGRFFTQTATVKSVANLNYQVEVPLVIDGKPLETGTYVVEAWLTTLPERQFAAAAEYMHVLPPAADAGPTSRRSR
jgi:hypothetical protein